MTYALYALRYATNPHRLRHENFMGLRHDPHDGPFPMDFFVWVAVGHGEVVLVDGGGGETLCARRGHTFLTHPIELLAGLGIAPADVTRMVVTHLHWDHAGNLDRFPNARVHIRADETAYVVGPAMERSAMRRPHDADQICDLVRLVHDGRVKFDEGAAEIAPGMFTHQVGGHTPGMQIVVVPTERGQVVLASDAMHFFDNLRTERPYPLVYDMQDYYRAMDLIERLADSADHIVPGHDPEVMRRYPPILDGAGVRLDRSPSPA